MTTDIVGAAATAVREAFESASQASLARVGIVLGSGLGHVGETLIAEGAKALPFSDIPNFPQSSVVGHAGRLLWGEVDGVPVLVMQGRVHRYEGYGADEVVFPIRVLAELGMQTLLLTNAAGGVDTDLQPGDLMLITDHLNLMLDAPATAPSHRPDWWRGRAELYDRALRRQIADISHELGIRLQQGVYAGMPGPNYETPAEVRMARWMGATAVGMSTVLEAGAAANMGIRVAGISCITNAASGISEEALDHSEVTETAKSVEHTFSRLVLEIVRRTG